MVDYVDYKDMAGETNRLYAVCKVNGKPSKDEPDCIRNPEGGEKTCIWFSKNGSDHCSHRWPPTKETK